jgi:hypothetical protein
MSQRTTFAKFLSVGSFSSSQLRSHVIASHSDRNIV